MRRPQLLVLLCVLSGILSAQQYNFRNYTVSDGLAQSQVYAMCEDPRGYLWLGTQGGGLNRFDGIEFTNYRVDDGLVNDFIYALSTDAKGNIWVGTDGGVSVFDGLNFSTLKLPGTPHRIRSIVCGTDGRTWIGTEDTGLFIVDGADITLHREGKTLPSKRITALFEDNDQSMWVGTPLGVSHFMTDGTTEVFTKKDGLPFTEVWAMARDAQNRLWFATYGGGLFRMAGKGKYIRFTQKDGLTTNTVHCMKADKLGRLWIGTAIGVTRLDGDKVTNFTETEGLCSNVVRCIEVDSWDNIWFGTAGGGISRLDGERFIHFNEKSGDMGTWVYSVFCDSSGHMWFGTSRGGVTEYDGTYYTNYYEGAGFTSGKVKCITQDTTRTLWFGTSGQGIYSFRNGSFRNYLTGGGGPSYVYCFVIDSLNRTWIGTAGYVYVYDPVGDEITKLGADAGFSGTNSERAYSMGIDGAGNIWVGTGGGVFLMQYDSAATSVKKRYTEKDGLSGDVVRSITCDNYGNIWFGTTKGISRFDGNTFLSYGTKQGLASNNVYSLIADKAGHLWSGTEKGLDRLLYDRQGQITAIKHYGKGEGFTGIETSQNAACLDTGTGVWFGTINGASVYHPEYDFENAVPPKVHITSIKLFFDPIELTPYGQRTDGYHWFPVPDSLLLPYAENNLRFEFTGIDLRNPEGVKFRWRLLGFESNWVPENSERQATYSNLQPGDYTFELQARNSDGYWSNIERFQFHITPPIYQRWSFRLVVGAGILILLILLFRWQLKTAQKRNKEQLEKVTLEKHVLELEQKALRLQMNPHFIFNALQSINGYIARNDSSEARKYLAKFGKLMRMTLENSRTSYTSIEQEAELLYNYTALEAMSQGNRFVTNIDIDERIRHESTFIPVMLIQPFVENAIIHGLKHKIEGGGELNIRFNIEGKENGTNGEQRCIVCEIEDNGVGRKKAAEYEAGIRKDHKSAALEITQERLAQMNEPGKPESSVSIIDLEDAQGNPRGTKVIIRIGNVIFE